VLDCGSRLATSVSAEAGSVLPAQHVSSLSAHAAGVASASKVSGEYAALRWPSGALTSTRTRNMPERPGSGFMKQSSKPPAWPSADSGCGSSQLSHGAPGWSSARTHALSVLPAGASTQPLTRRPRPANKTVSIGSIAAAGMADRPSTTLITPKRGAQSLYGGLNT
jgi:hypothetical protein